MIRKNRSGEETSNVQDSRRKISARHHKPGKSKVAEAAIVLALTFAISAMPTVSTGQPSDPAGGVGAEIAQLEAEIARIQEKLEDLQMLQSEAVERYNRSEDELARIASEILATEAEGAAAVAAATRARESFEERARLAYKRGPDSEKAVELLATGDSIARVGAGLRALARLSLADADAARRARQEAARLGEIEEEKRVAYSEKARLQAQIQVEIDSVEASIAEERRLRNSLDAQKRAALERAEAARREALESRARKLLDGVPGVPRIAVDSARLKIAVDTALAQIGKPYRYGGSGPDTFDCSGLIMYSLRAAGVSGVPHRADLQYFLSDRHPSRSELRSGDLVFFSSNGTPEGIGHNGMYIGDGLMVHAPHTGDVVRLSPVDRRNYFGATRLAI